jgi:ubiquinone/menaquinone biosynthesis C-methylase UbiE
MQTEEHVTAGDEDARAKNYFSSAAAARRYAQHRPAAHSRVLPSLLQALAEALPVAHALDVGCGTGSSTHALLPYASSVVGIDSSREMLAQAEPHPAIAYRRGYAEALPFRAGEFDLVTVSSAYHWFDHDRFLGEAARVLRPGGWLALYKIGSMGRIEDNNAFELWRREVFRARFPKVARNDERVDAGRAAQFGFVELTAESATHRQRHTLDTYVENLLTHSSVIRVVDERNEPVEATRQWLREELARFFAAGPVDFSHEAQVHILRKPAAV